MYVPGILEQVLFNTTGLVMQGEREAWELKADGYRYALGRSWGGPLFPTERALLWVMLNPSTADHRDDDQTMRKVIGFSKAFGAGAVVVVNLFAFRTPDVKELRGRHARSLETQECSPCESPVGKYNDEVLRAALSMYGDALFAWGHGGAAAKMTAERAAEVVGRFGAPRRGVAYLPGGPIPVATTKCLGFAKGGQPRHPLMLPYTTPREPFFSDGRVKKKKTTRTKEAHP